MKANLKSYRRDYNAAVRLKFRLKARSKMKLMSAILFSIALLALICAPVYGQWVKVPAGGIPRGTDGKPNLSAPAPRTADGHLELSGGWEAANGGKYVPNIGVDRQPGHR